LNSLFYNSEKTPTLSFAVRATLRNFNKVTKTSLIVFIMYTKFGSTLYVLAVLWMLNLKVNGNFNAFITTVAYHHTSYSFQFSILHLFSLRPSGSITYDKASLTFTHYRFNPGNIALNVTYGFGILQFSRNRLRAQIKQMTLKLL